MSCIANVVSADYWTFTLNRYRCFEPREWTTDRVHFQFSLVTRGQNGQVAQNITKYRGSSSLVDRGDASDPNVMWQDITIPETETDLLVTSSMWNVGDGDPQKVGFRKCEWTAYHHAHLLTTVAEIAQIVLKVIRGNFVVSVISTIISTVLKQFEDLYQCDGPVVLDAWIWSSQQLRSMQYDKTNCWSRPYDFQTKQGCVDHQPFNLTVKQSHYWAEHCIVRRQGQSSNSGEANRVQSGAATTSQYWPVYGLFLLSLGAVCFSFILF